MVVNPIELKKILTLHHLYLIGDSTGKRAYLEEVDLGGADLRVADLRGAYLEEVDLGGADLRGADLRGADLRGAYLGGADLRGANLWEANLWGANLGGANFKGANLPNFQICPQEGSFIGYKKMQERVVLKLEIQADSPRTSSLVGRKCRAKKVKVLEALNSIELKFSSQHDQNFFYEIGQIIEEPSYNPDIRIECTSGIHFFMTQKEAKEY